MSIRPTSSDRRTTRKYSDIQTLFQVNPITGGISTVVNDDSIKQAVRNIVLTNKGERPYNGNLGGDLYKLLFENIDEQVEALAKIQIQTALQRYEPRIDVVSVGIIGPDPSAQIFEQVVRGSERIPIPSENHITINVVYRIINTQENRNINIVVERLR